MAVRLRLRRESSRRMTWHPAGRSVESRSMKLKCPACTTETLEPATLIGGPGIADLTARECSTCHGQWVEGEAYLTWVEKVDRKERERPPTPDVAVTTEKAKPKLCPACGRFLTRAAVGNGVPFLIDRCGTCAGFWFEPGEWEALRALDLHIEAHQVFSDAWQYDVQKIERKRQHERLLISKLGEADWREIQRVKAWLEAHPRKAELYSVLMEDANLPPVKGPKA